MKINFDKIICINLAAANALQLFSICETYFIGFESMLEAKMAGVAMKWLNEERESVAFVLDGRFTIADKFNPLSKKEYDRIKKIKPVKTPKMPKTASALNNYKAFLSEGHDIRTPSMDSMLDASRQRDSQIEEEKESLPVILETDAILEKISKYGIESITSEEKKFLDSLK